MVDEHNPQPLNTPGSPDRFIRACRGESVDATPVWIMRQAGRYLPEYRKLRERYTFRDFLEQPDLATEVTLQPLRRFPLDAAIIFADILTVTEAMGVPFEIVKGKGPVMEKAVRTAEDIDALRDIDPERDVAPHLQAIKQVVGELNGRIPLLGFSGAPFTLACYLVEGGPSKQFAAVRRLINQTPELADRLFDRIADSVIALLKAQIAAGVSAVQVFDTWAGMLSPADYARFALPAAEKIFRGLADTGVPRVYYVGHVGHYLEALKGVSADIISVDWRVGLDVVSHTLDKAVQGNLDPCALYLPEPELAKAIDGVLASARGLERGHIFNLGHGIMPDMSPDRLKFLVEYVHEQTAA